MSTTMTTNETYDLDAEILRAANPYRIPTDADLVEAARGCNQYKHKPGCPEAEGDGESDKASEPKDKEAIKKNFEKIRQEKYDLEDELDKYTGMLNSLKDSGEDELEESIRKKRRDVFERLRVVDKKYDDEVQMLRDTGLWGHL